MNTNDKIKAILNLRYFVPDMSLTIESGIAPVVLRLVNVYVGGDGYILSVSGCGETMEDAVDNLMDRLTSTDEYVIVDINMKDGPRFLRFECGTWVTKHYGF